MQINSDLYADEELKKMIQYDTRNVDIGLKYTKKYYAYFHRITNLLGLFLEGLNESLMPNTTKSRTKLRYSNNQHFFACYSDVKKNISEILSGFRLEKFKIPVNSIIIFYYT